MNINQVTNAVRFGKFIRNPKSTKANLAIEWDSARSEQELKDDAGRVYILCVNGEIMKIGGSQGKNGIKSTMTFYTGGNTGKPSIRSFGINLLILREIDKGNLVEVFMISSKQVLAPVKGLFKQVTLPVSAFKEMESKCVKDFVDSEGCFPDWNYQESGKAWESDIQSAHASMLAKK